MAIFLPAATDELPALDELTPREIVVELDKHVVGQTAAKRAVAGGVAESHPPPEVGRRKWPKIFCEEILMIGSPASANEIARRLARLANSPFLKVEASKFHRSRLRRRDVRIDDPRLGRDFHRHGARRRLDEISDKAECCSRRAPARFTRAASAATIASSVRTAHRGIDTARRTGRGELSAHSRETAYATARRQPTTARWRLKRGNAISVVRIISNTGVEEMDINIKDMLPGLFGNKTKKRKMRVAEAIDVLIPEEESQADRYGSGDARRGRSCGAIRHHLSRRD